MPKEPIKKVPAARRYTTVLLEERQRGFLVWLSKQQGHKPTQVLRALVHNALVQALNSEKGTELKDFLAEYVDGKFEDDDVDGA